MMLDDNNWNDLDAGGRDSVPRPSEKCARPDLQEKMRRRFRRNQSKHHSTGENTSLVRSNEGAVRQIPESKEDTLKQRRRQKEDSSRDDETPNLRLNDPDANGNFMFHDGYNSPLETERPKASGGQDKDLVKTMTGRSAKQSSVQSHFDKTLSSVLGELDRDDKTQRRQQYRDDSTAVFQNNFEDLESSRVLNIPAGSATGGNQGSNGCNGHALDFKRQSKQTSAQSDDADDEDDDAMEGKPHNQKENRDIIQQMLDSLMKRERDRNNQGDPFAALLGARQDGNGANDGVLRGRESGADPLQVLLGGRPDNNRGQKMQHDERNENNEPLMALLGRDRRNPLVGFLDRRDNTDEQNRIQNAGNDFLSSVMTDRSNAGGLGLLGMGQNKTDSVGNDRKQDNKTERGKTAEENHDDENVDPMERKRQAVGTGAVEDPLAAMLNEMTKDSKGSVNPFAALGIAGAGSGERGRDKDRGYRNLDPLAVLQSSRGGGINPFMMDRSGESSGKSMDSGENPLSAMISGFGGRSRSGGGGIEGLQGMLGGGGDEMPTGSQMSQMFGSLMGGGGDGMPRGSQMSQMLGSLLGGGVNGMPRNSQMPQMSGSLMGGGSDQTARLSQMSQMLGSMMGGGGEGMARGSQMSQMLGAFMGGDGGSKSGGDPMASALSALSGVGGGPNEKKMRQLMGQAELGEDVSPNNPSDNDIVQQLLAYESIKAHRNPAPRAENAMHTVIIVDTSGSMDGEPLFEAGLFVSQFVNGLEELQFEYNLQENVALVAVGGETQVVQHFTNDYSLLRQATDSLTAFGSSPLHIGLLIPTAILSHDSHDSRSGICRMGNHIACPRVIFISDGYPNSHDDIPGQQLRPDDPQVLTVQNGIVGLMQKVTENTLCKIYCVPVGNAHINFLEMLSQSSGGKIVEPSNARRMSRCLLHHNLVSKLHETAKRRPTREEVAKILKQVTATADEDDINGVLEVYDEGEPDVQTRDQLVAQERLMSMQAQGRGKDGYREGMNLEEMAQLTGKGQGGLQRPGGGGRMTGGGIPMMMRGRGQPGSMLAIEDNQGLGSLNGSGSGGLLGQMGMGGGDVRDSSGLLGLMGMGRGDGSGSGGLPGRIGMGGGNGRGFSGLLGQMDKDGGNGSGSGGTLGQMGMIGGDGRDSSGLLGLLGMGRGDRSGSGGLPGRLGIGGGNGRGYFGEDITGSGKMLGLTNIGDGGRGSSGLTGHLGKRTLDESGEMGGNTDIQFGRGGSGGLNECTQGNGIYLDGNTKEGGQWNSPDNRANLVPDFGIINGDVPNEKARDGSSNVMFGMGENASKQTTYGNARDPRGKSESEGEPVMLGMGGLGGSQSVMLGLGAVGNSRQGDIPVGFPPNDRTNRDLPCTTKPGLDPQPVRGRGFNDRGYSAGAGGSEEPLLGLIGGVRSNRNTGLRERDYFNDVPPCSFGIDEDGNTRHASLMDDDDRDTEKENEYMEKLASMLGDSEHGSGGILGNDTDEPGFSDGSGLLRGFPDMLGL